MSAVARSLRVGAYSRTWYSKIYDHNSTMPYVAYVVTQFHMVSSDKARDSAIVLVQAAAAMQQGSGNSAFAQACLIEPRALDPA